MARKVFSLIIVTALFLCSMPAFGAEQEGQTWQGNWESLDSRPVPEWWPDAKFGIFIHWGVYSVPAWCDGWYAEWYYQLIQDGPGGSKTMREHHRNTWGEGFRYPQFAPLFKAEKYDPAAWAKLFNEAGARYVILTSKHHDGFCLWDAPDSKGWNAVDVGPRKDLIDPLAKAVRAEGLKFGLYYSMLEWNLGDNLPGNKYPKNSDQYVSQHTLPQIKDLVKRYNPSIMWPDGEWGKNSSYWRSEEFLAWFANKREVVWNDRWGKETRGKHGSFYTTEYGKHGKEGGAHPWEETRGIGGSFGYNSWYEDKDKRYPSSQELLDVFVNVLSRGGNFLLNIGPKADGTIIDVFQNRLRDFGRFLRANGQGVYGSSLPFKSEQGDDIKFTRNKNNKTIYAFVKNKPGNSITFNGVFARKGEDVILLADPKRAPLAWSNQGGNLTIKGIDKVSRHGEFYWVFKIPGGFNADTNKVTETTNITSGTVNPVRQIEANCIAEITCDSEKTYQNPFIEVEVDAVIVGPDGAQVRIPAFWAGGNRWVFRYASSVPGTYAWDLDCSDATNSKLHGMAGKIEVIPYRGDNVLYRHGPIRVAKDLRHFAHADGTPFFWLADTWWKNLCRRMTWEGFQDLTADRKAKGFTAIQIVCGPYPDEDMMETRSENEGGKPYKTKDFSVLNPSYFNYADRRIEHLVDAGIVPVIVGGWGRPQHGGKSTLVQAGLDGFKRHWRNLVARYGAYPTVWVVGGEARDAYGPWSELAKFLKATDPYHRPLTYHAPGHPRRAIKDNAVFDFDMVAIGHDGFKTAGKTLELMKSCLSQDPSRPVLCGEACYEGHMQTNFQDVQRHLFWSFMLSGAAGHTYGAAGIWHASVEGDPGITPVYDLTTWKEGMACPGSTQIGLGKKLLEKYPWARFQTHPEWVQKGCFAAGIPGQVRVIYLPRRNIYNWSGPEVRNLDPSVDWHAYYFDPATGRIFDQGTIKAGDNKPAEPVEFRKDVPSPQDWVLVFEREKSKRRTDQ